MRFVFFTFLLVLNINDVFPYVLIYVFAYPDIVEGRPVSETASWGKLKHSIEQNGEE